ncbi:MAG: hypothetical protein C5B49_11960 [Bdellovibrio sp.]|nr:MAG: hypothetical protein C5B49_11960 [Bdellovibrio sp.]
MNELLLPRNRQASEGDRLRDQMLFAIQVRLRFWRSNALWRTRLDSGGSSFEMREVAASDNHEGAILPFNPP